MWYTVLITLVVDIGGLIVIYALLRDRVRRATLAEAQIAEIRDEVSRLLVELNQTTDRNVLLIEDRIGSLNELLAAADKKIGLLHREIEKHDVGARIYSRLAAGTAGAPGPAREAASTPARTQAPPQPAPLAIEAAEPALPKQKPQPAVEPSRLAVEPSRLAVEPSRLAVEPSRLAVEPSRLAVELSDRGGQGRGGRGGGRADDGSGGEIDVRQRVVMLHRAGFSASLIATRVGAPLGEVELIIGLEQRKGKA